ncbi:ricin-type beta-trefoil lectin domain protein [Cohaesibacter celericrescens]|uniref:ricin-type beta-trefoil lectin domain protein n=1 Tax=Cohaesibacter celericrescens TaxID=2067669 RepID=UPI003565BE38
MKNKFSRLTTFILATGIAASTVLADDVEVTLKDDLDGMLNGYCLDISGGGDGVDPSKGLQSHTCYSYRGSLGEDQIVDSEKLAKGTIYLPRFEVCATMTGLEAGATVALKACDGGALQSFDFTDEGLIKPASTPDMCLTSGKETRLGRGGTSQHQIKSLTLQSCTDAMAPYQLWHTRSKDD